MNSIMNFRTLFIIISFLPLLNPAYGQNSYEVRIKALADEMAQQIKTSELKNIGVLGFFTDAGEEGQLGKLLAEDFSVHLTRPEYGYNLYNRAYIEHLIKENQLGTVEKLVEENSITELGKLQGLEGFVVGTYSRIGDVLRVRVKLLNAQTALQIGASMQNLDFDDNLKQYLGLSYGKAENNSNRGFSGPLSSNEEYNNPLTVSDGCEEYKFGDICFYNSLSKPFQVRFDENFNPYGEGHQNRRVKAGGKQQEERVNYKIYIITIQPGETQCIYGVGIGPGAYGIYEADINVNNNANYIRHQSLRTGQILIEQCKSKTFTIK